jgi:hypothetical protein
MLPDHADMWVEAETEIETKEPLRTRLYAERAVRKNLGRKWQGKIRISKVTEL